MNRVVEVFRRIERHNPISGHRWVEYGDLLRYEVRTTFGLVTKHKTEKSADAEKAKCDAFDLKYPFTPPRSERERIKCHTPT